MNNVASGDRINYSLRPAKSVERKMIKDIISRTYPFGAVSDYRYIGFGSKYFSDFKLLHRSLHISDMISIESDVSRSEKYIFNRPFECVKLRFGTSTEILGQLDYEKKFVSWLDYDTAIAAHMLDDVSTLVDNIHPGSLVLVSYNSIAPKLNKLREEFCLPDAPHSELLKRKLESVLPVEYVPLEIPSQGLSKSSIYSQIVRKIFINKINNALASKNAALAQEEKWKCHQIAYFNYKDGADMSTLGWIFYQEENAEDFARCNFGELEFYSETDTACVIEIPNFTIKELRHLQEFMPLSTTGIDRERVHRDVYSDEDVQAFSRIYKYFPSFVDIEVA
jgi:hypothetical protein